MWKKENKWIGHDCIQFTPLIKLFEKIVKERKLANLFSFNETQGGPIAGFYVFTVLLIHILAHKFTPLHYSIMIFNPLYIPLSQ